MTQYNVTVWGVTVTRYLVRLTLIHYSAFFGIEDHVALDRNLGYNTLLLRLIPGDLLRARPHRELHALPGLKTVGLHCQTPTLMHCHGGRQFVPFL